MRIWVSNERIYQIIGLEQFKGARSSFIATHYDCVIVESYKYQTSPATFCELLGASLPIGLMASTHFSCNN